MIEKPTAFSYPLKVRYAEVDQQSIVYFAHYLTYFDIGVHEFFHALPYDYTEIGRRTGFDFNMAKGVVDYRQPLRLDENFAVEVDIERVGRSSLTFALALRVGGEDEPRATGKLVNVHADQRTNRSSPLPEHLLALLAKRGFSRIG